MNQEIVDKLKEVISLAEESNDMLLTSIISTVLGTYYLGEHSLYELALLLQDFNIKQLEIIQMVKTKLN